MSYRFCFNNVHALCTNVLINSILKSETKADDDKKHTLYMLEKHAGSWVGDETTDEIMDKIREDSSIRDL